VGRLAKAFAVILALQAALAAFAFVFRDTTAEERPATGLALITPSNWQPATLDASVTVMTYNLQEGFDRDAHFNLDQQAAVIEAAHPDLVVLQEVSRGWLVAAGMDQARWLAERLGMEAAFGANSDDELWGNVILSRAPIRQALRRQYTTTQNLKRCLVGVQVDTAAGPLWIFGTHLDNPPAATAVREAQTQELIDFWGRRSPSLLLGDLNVDPGDPIFGQLEGASLRDLDAGLPAGSYTSSDHRLIDHILATPNVRLDEIHVPAVWTSDHRPVVARVTITR
jgi:endonuclease/exonuclease/phosphatase family metal-dependent hydrolase